MQHLMQACKSCNKQVVGRTVDSCSCQSNMDTQLALWNARADLKPQDSFGRFVFKNSWSSESAPYHQKAPLNPPAIVLNDML